MRPAIEDNLFVGDDIRELAFGSETDMIAPFAGYPLTAQKWTVTACRIARTAHYPLTRGHSLYVQHFTDPAGTHHPAGTYRVAVEAHDSGITKFQAFFYAKPETTLGQVCAYVRRELAPGLRVLFARQEG